jgi:hypothetical protein
VADKLKKYIHEHLKKGYHPEHVRRHVVGHGHHPGIVQKHIKSYYRKRTISLFITIIVLIAIAAGVYFAAQKYGRADVPYLELDRIVYFPLASPVDKIGITSDDQFLFTLDFYERQTHFQIKDGSITTLAVSFPETSIPVGTFAHPETYSLKCRIEDGKIKMLYKPGDILLRTLKAENYTKCFFSFSEDKLFAVTDNFVSIYRIRIIEP